MAEFPALYLWTDAFIADITHLSNEEVGVYIRLISFAWRTRDCSIPDDDFRLRNIVGMTVKKWASFRPVMAQFFQIDGGRWTQKRLTAEREKVSRLAKRGRAGAEARWKAKSLKNNNPSDAQAYAKPMLDACQTDGIQNQNQNHIEDDGGNGLSFRELILEAIGVDRSGLTANGRILGNQADMAEAWRWLKMPGVTEPVALEEIRAVMRQKKDGAPSAFKYFTRRMQALSGALTAPQPEGVQNGPRRSSGRDADTLSRIIRSAADQRREDRD